MKELIILLSAFMVLKYGFDAFRKSIGTNRHINNLKWTIIVFGCTGLLLSILFPSLGYSVGEEYLQMNELGVLFLFFLSMMYEYYRTKEFKLSLGKSIFYTGTLILISGFLVNINIGRINLGYSMIFILIFTSFGVINFFFSPIISAVNIFSIYLIIANYGTYTLGCYDFINIIDFLDTENIFTGYLMLSISTLVSVANSYSYFSGKDVKEIAESVFQNING